MRKVVRKDAPKQENGKPKEHWSDRHKILISVVTVLTFIGSIAFLWIVGPHIK
jgi:hypothetical protein